MAENYIVKYKCGVCFIRCSSFSEADHHCHEEPAEYYCCEFCGFETYDNILAS